MEINLFSVSVVVSVIVGSLGVGVGVDVCAGDFCTSFSFGAVAVIANEPKDCGDALKYR